jgi:hypothetical protein
VSSVREITDQESGEGTRENTKRRPENRFSNRRHDSAENSSVTSGPTRASSILVGCGSEQVTLPRCLADVIESGGDEETRTPDPLLAKEMLCQLSYVPRPRCFVTTLEWWAFLDSNQRPLPYQGSALTN